jgi:hypothetical protein
MMRRILVLVTVVAMMVAMMVVMAGTASAQPTVLGACLTPAQKVGTLILVTTPSGEHLACIGKDPF